MPTPRHRQRALRRRRRTQRGLALAALAVVIGTALLTLDGGSDDAELTAARPEPPPSSTSSSSLVTSSTTSTAAAPATTTTAVPTSGSDWYAVVLSARKDASDADALRAELAELGVRGRVLDTDDFRTGDAQAPEHLPAPGLLIGAVGPFGSLAQVQAWCADYAGDQGCQARQLVPR